MAGEKAPVDRKGPKDAIDRYPDPSESQAKIVAAEREAKVRRFLSDQVKERQWLEVLGGLDYLSGEASQRSDALLTVSQIRQPRIDTDLDNPPHVDVIYTFGEKRSNGDSSGRDLRQWQVVQLSVGSSESGFTATVNGIFLPIPRRDAVLRELKAAVVEPATSEWHTPTATEYLAERKAVGRIPISASRPQRRR